MNIILTKALIDKSVYFLVCETLKVRIELLPGTYVVFIEAPTRLYF